MKKSILIPAVTVTLLLGSELAKAEEVVVPITDMQLEQGNIVDISGNEGVPEDVTAVDDIPAETPEPEAPIEKEEVVTTPSQPTTPQEKPHQIIDEVKEESSDLKVEVQKPENEITVLTEGVAQVESLDKTGIPSKGLLYSITAALLALFSLGYIKKKKVKQN